MIKLPPEFHSTRFPGYFWHRGEQWLYSLKSGELKRLTKYRNFTFPHSYRPPFTGWIVSVRGRKRYLPLSELRLLTGTEVVVIPYAKLEGLSRRSTQREIPF